MTMPVRRNPVKVISSVVVDWSEVYIVDFYICGITVLERLYYSCNSSAEINETKAK